MKISITQRDILTGVRLSGSQCPIAKAIRRTVKKATKINVGEREISFWQGGHRQGFDTPVEARAFIICFDYGRIDPEPFDFDLG
jgi:hypothetical protein